MLGLIAPIHNEPACSTASCHAHPPSQPVLGVLDVQLSLAPVDERPHGLASARCWSAWSATVAAVVLLAFLLAWAWCCGRSERLTPGRSASWQPATSACGFRERLGATSSGDLARRVEPDGGRAGRAHAELAAWSRTLEERVEEETRELERAHRRMLLVEKMASLGKLAAVVAHEINNPLAGIATYARLLRRRRPRRRDGRSRAGRPRTSTGSSSWSRSEALRCGDIVRNLLLFSRSPGGAVRARRGCAPLVERCVLLVRHQAELRALTIAVEPARRPARGRVRRVPGAAGAAGLA